MKNAKIKRPWLGNIYSVCWPSVFVLQICVDIVETVLKEITYYSKSLLHLKETVRLMRLT